mmetsp:Transcript_31847/g.99409  ORF Transcript_31847/g.99409 Transcript_31847/m.99409 type:complete len:272 (+) Transcript_31847:197-1012(+)
MPPAREQHGLKGCGPLRRIRSRNPLQKPVYGGAGSNLVLRRADSKEGHAGTAELLWPQDALVPAEVPPQPVREEELGGDVVQRVPGPRLPVEEVVQDVIRVQKDHDGIQQHQPCHTARVVPPDPAQDHSAEGVAHKVSPAEAMQLEDGTRCTRSVCCCGDLRVDLHGDERDLQQEDRHAPLHQHPQQAQVRQQSHAYAMHEEDGQPLACWREPSRPPQPVPPQPARHVGSEAEPVQGAVREDAQKALGEHVHAEREVAVPQRLQVVAHARQ